MIKIISEDYKEGYLKALKETNDIIDEITKNYITKKNHTSSKRLKSYFNSKLWVIKEIRERIKIKEKKQC